MKGSKTKPQDRRSLSQEHQVPTWTSSPVCGCEKVLIWWTFPCLQVHDVTHTSFDLLLRTELIPYQWLPEAHYSACERAFPFFFWRSLTFLQGFKPSAWAWKWFWALLVSLSNTVWTNKLQNYHLCNFHGNTPSFRACFQISNTPKYNSKVHSNESTVIFEWPKQILGFKSLWSWLLTDF